MEQNTRTAKRARLTAGGREDELEGPLARGTADDPRVNLVHQHGARLPRRAATAYQISRII